MMLLPLSLIDGLAVVLFADIVTTLFNSCLQCCTVANHTSFLISLEIAMMFSYTFLSLISVSSNTWLYCHCTTILFSTAFTVGFHDAGAMTLPALLPAIHYYATVASLCWYYCFLAVALLSLVMLIMISSSWKNAVPAGMIH